MELKYVYRSNFTCVLRLRTTPLPKIGTAVAPVPVPIILTFATVKSLVLLSTVIVYIDPFKICGVALALSPSPSIMTVVLPSYPLPPFPTSILTISYP